MEAISTFPWHVREENLTKCLVSTIVHYGCSDSVHIGASSLYIIIIIIFYRSQLFSSLDYFECIEAFVHNLKLMANSKSSDNLSCRDYRHMHHYIRINKKFHNMDLFTNMGIRIKRSVFDILILKLFGGPLEIIGICSILEVHLEWLENLFVASGQLRL